MTIDKTKFQAVLEAATIVSDKVNVLSGSVMLADTNNPFNATFVNIFEGIEAIETWANAKILEADQENVMSDFLAEMKVVFDKYAASMEVGSDESGYGTNYGGGSSVGVQFVATLDGVTASKEINKSVIVGSDLV